MPLFDKDKDKDSKKADDAEKNVSLAIHTASGTTTVSDRAETAAKAFGDQFIGDTSVEDRADKIRMSNGSCPPLEQLTRMHLV